MSYSEIVKESKKTIRCDMRKEPCGWTLTVDMPTRVSSEDQTAMLEWVRDYQKGVKAQHPHWLTSFRVTKEGYALHILKAENVQDMLAAVDLAVEGEKIRDCWSNTIEYA